MMNGITKIPRQNVINKLQKILNTRYANRLYSSTKKKCGILHHEWVVNGKVASAESVASTKKTVIFLHGLLGNGKNLRSPAKVLTESNSDQAALLLDLRGHGNSSSFSSSLTTTTTETPHTIENCAKDVMETVESLNLTGIHSPIGIVGHSFGGRCALHYTHHLLVSQSNSKDQLLNPPKVTWLLDTVPGAAHSSVAQVIEALTSITMPIESKKELVRILTKEKGLDAMIANWMTTNLKKATEGKGFEFQFDLEVAQAVLNDFQKQDFLGDVEDCLSTQKPVEVKEDLSKMHLVMGGKNLAWTTEVVELLKEVRSKATTINGDKLFHLVPLAKAGHWVHVDDLDGLMKAMSNSFS